MGYPTSCPGTVVRDVASSADLRHGHSLGPQHVWLSQDVLTTAAAAGTEGQDVWVLQHHEQIRDTARATRFDELLLQRECVVVRNRSQAPDLDRWHVRRASVPRQSIPRIAPGHA